jgi:malate dehydrogenase
MSKTFCPAVQLRGAEIIKARGFSSAASAANAAIDHMRTWVFGTNGGWTAMGVESDGSYGIPKGLNSSFPVIVKDGQYTIVKDAPITPFYKPMLEKTINEL